MLSGAPRNSAETWQWPEPAASTVYCDYFSAAERILLSCRYGPPVCRDCARRAPPTHGLRTLYIGKSCMATGYRDKNKKVVLSAVVSRTNDLLWAAPTNYVRSLIPMPRPILAGQLPSHIYAMYKNDNVHLACCKRRLPQNMTTPKVNNNNSH